MLRDVLAATGDSIAVCLTARERGECGGACGICGEGEAWTRIAGDSANGYACAECTGAAL